MWSTPVYSTRSRDIGRRLELLLQLWRQVLVVEVEQDIVQPAWHAARSPFSAMPHYAFEGVLYQRCFNGLIGTFVHGGSLGSLRVGGTHLPTTLTFERVFSFWRVRRTRTQKQTGHESMIHPLKPTRRSAPTGLLWLSLGLQTFSTCGRTRKGETTAHKARKIHEAFRIRHVPRRSG